MADDVQKAVNEYSVIQQQVQLIMAQRQQLDLQMKEIDLALSELEKTTGSVYKAIGGVMVLRDKESAVKDLTKEKEEISGRSEFLERQEKKMTERFTASRKKLEELAKAQQANGPLRG